MIATISVRRRVAQKNRHAHAYKTKLDLKFGQSFNGVCSITRNNDFSFARRKVRRTSYRETIFHLRYYILQEKGMGGASGRLGLS